MTEPLDAELLKDLRGLGKPPSFGGNDAEHQDFRFSFRSYMSFVSAVSHTLMDKCEVERNPISLAAVKALGDAHLKCCIQMYYSLTSITKGSVRTLVRSVEESNGACFVCCSMAPTCSLILWCVLLYPLGLSFDAPFLPSPHLVLISSSLRLFSFGLHMELALLHSCTFVFFVTELLFALSVTLPTHSRGLKVATRESCICHGSGARMSAIASEVTRKPSRSAAAAAVT